ncbi:MAG TPA: bifunctional adenosylcobinamide kinase/adenosylcobinamide-phosphate guanylyltransferase [Acidobacteriota bacterium]
MERSRKSAPELIVITGGARSGKSRHALAWAAQFRRRAFIATAQELDDEMRDRIARHRGERGSAWTTFEEPIRLAAALRRAQQDHDAVVVDCLTFWLSNLILQPRRIDLERPVQELLGVLERRRAAIALVTNEVGSGIVPENPLARRFRDLCGQLNQQVGDRADRVILVVAGRALELPRAGPPAGRRRG